MEWDALFLAMQPFTKFPEEQVFVGNRVRMQRLTDARFFSGWIQAWKAGVVSIKLNGNPALVDGDQLSLEIEGAAKTAHCRATVNSREENRATLRVTEAIRFSAPAGKARHRAKEMWCSFIDGGRRVVGEVVEVSDEGIGVHLSEPVRPGAEIQTSITNLRMSVCCDAEVRYCRTDREVPGRFRAGILLKEMPPPEAERWALLRMRVARGEA